MIAASTFAVPLALAFALSPGAGAWASEPLRAGHSAAGEAEVGSKVSTASVAGSSAVGDAKHRAGTPLADAEVQAIEKQLERIRSDPEARRKFYSEADAMVNDVRRGRPIPQLPPLESQARTAASQLGVPSRTAPEIAVPAAHRDLSSPPEAHEGNDPEFSEPRPSPPGIINLTGPDGVLLDPRTVSRLLYWAQKNGCPEALALAIAWQESRISVDAPNGPAGEIGIMQILPGRAVDEGVSPARLRDPDADIWLGTRLLAEYYREQGSVARAAMMYVGGPHVFEKRYSAAVREYIAGYSASVESYDSFFARRAAF